MPTAQRTAEQTPSAMRRMTAGFGPRPYRRRHQQWFRWLRAFSAFTLMAGTTVRAIHPRGQNDSDAEVAARLRGDVIAPGLIQVIQAIPLASRHGRRSHFRVGAVLRSRRWACRVSALPDGSAVPGYRDHGPCRRHRHLAVHGMPCAHPGGTVAARAMDTDRVRGGGGVAGDGLRLDQARGSPGFVQWQEFRCAAAGYPLSACPASRSVREQG